LGFQVNQAIYKDYDYRLERTAKMRDFRSTLQSRSTKFSNSVIRKYHLNPAIRKKSEKNPIIRKKKFKRSTMSSKIVFRSTLQSGSTEFQTPQSESIRSTLQSWNIKSTLQSGSTKFSNPAIGKYQVNPEIRKHRVFKPYEGKVSSQPYN